MTVGGAERVALNLAIGFDEIDVPVNLVLGNAVGAYLERVPESVRVVDLGIDIDETVGLTRVRQVIQCLPGLIRHIRQDSPEVILSGFIYFNVATIIAARLSNRHPRVFIRQDSHLSSMSMARRRLHGSGRLRPLLARAFYPHATGVIAVSSAVAVDLVKRCKLDPDKTHVIYNPVVSADLKREAAEPSDQIWFEDSDCPVVLGAGRLCREKDFVTLLRAFALLRRKRNARLIVLGDGPDRSRLETISRELGIHRHVSLPGFVKNPFSYMARASVFVLSSVTEGLPTVLIEAMACGCPVVSTQCPGGPAEILDNGRYGRLVPVGNVEALSTAISATLDDTIETDVLVKRAEDFSRERIVQQYLELISGDSVLGAS